MKTTTIKFKRYINNNPSQVKQINIYSNGSKHWFLNGDYHREDGPAIERSNGSKHWCLNGNIHREDGPAYIGRDGSKQWCLNDKRYFSEKDYWEAMEDYKKRNKNTK